MDIQELIKKYKELGFDEMEIGVAEEFGKLNEELNVKPESKEADKADMEQAEYKEIKAKEPEVDGDTIAKKLLKQLESLMEDAKIEIEIKGDAEIEVKQETEEDEESEEDFGELQEEYECEDDLGLYIINDGRMYNKYCRPAQKEAEAGKEVDWLKIAVEGARRYRREIEDVKFGPDKLKATANYIKDYYEKDIKGASLGESKLNEYTDTKKLFGLDDKIADVQNELIKINQEIEKIETGSTLTAEQEKLFNRRKQANRLLTRLNAQRDKVLEESLNEATEWITRAFTTSSGYGEKYIFWPMAGSDAVQRFDGRLSKMSAIAQAKDRYFVKQAAIHPDILGFTITRSGDFSSALDELEKLPIILKDGTQTQYKFEDEVPDELLDEKQLKLKQSWGLKESVLNRFEKTFKAPANKLVIGQDTGLTPSFSGTALQKIYDYIKASNLQGDVIITAYRAPRGFNIVIGTQEGPFTVMTRSGKVLKQGIESREKATEFAKGSKIDESKMNEISLELADKVNSMRRKDAVLKTVDAKKAELLAENPQSEDDMLLADDNVKKAREEAKIANKKAIKNDRLFSKWKKSKGIEETLKEALKDNSLGE